MVAAGELGVRLDPGAGQRDLATHTQEEPVLCILGLRVSHLKMERVLGLGVNGSQ